MKTWELTEKNDIKLDGSNDISWVSGDDEIIQNLKVRLITNVGEWFLDKGMGLNRSIIFGKRPNKDWITDTVTNTILQDKRISNVEYVNISLDARKRLCTIDFKAKLVSGNIIESVVII